MSQRGYLCFNIFIKSLQQAFLKAFFPLVSRRRIFAFSSCCNESNLVEAAQDSRASAKLHQLAAVQEGTEGQIFRET